MGLFGEIKSFFSNDFETSIVKAKTANYLRWALIAMRCTNEDFDVKIATLDFYKKLEELENLKSPSNEQLQKYIDIINEIYESLEKRLHELGIYDDVKQLYELEIEQKSDD